MKNDQQRKDLKEMAKQQKMNLAAQSFIESLHFAFRFSVFSDGSPQPQPTLFIKKTPSGR
ncbi:hypothetical protein [Bacillus amyloliquefaciens]|uniref:hypothetical protein n=1 Tax=Bacillus amyloliquefaciens TaxID=1390 RepID=UPI002DBBEDBD|nr:hypothetical protein [Bacillus amyloliquefaciens]MEC3838711.1 hypothetical protein [Bacillus amyloliquefaciens]